MLESEKAGNSVASGDEALTVVDVVDEKGAITQSTVSVELVLM